MSTIKARLDTIIIRTHREDLQRRAGVAALAFLAVMGWWLLPRPATLRDLFRRP